MSRKIILTLPVESLEASRAFYLAMGFAINPQVSDHSSALLAVSEEISIMLLTHDKFREFAPPGNDIVSGRKATEVLISLSLESKEEVDSLADTASKAGASSFEDAEDHGFMYARSFQDLDGHGWQLMWVDMSAIPADHASAEVWNSESVDVTGPGAGQSGLREAVDKLEGPAPTAPQGL